MQKSNEFAHAIYWLHVYWELIFLCPMVSVRDRTRLSASQPSVLPSLIPEPSSKHDTEAKHQTSVLTGRSCMDPLLSPHESKYKLTSRWHNQVGLKLKVLLHVEYSMWHEDVQNYWQLIFIQHTPASASVVENLSMNHQSSPLQFAYSLETLPPVPSINLSEYTKKDC